MNRCFAFFALFLGLLSPIPAIAQAQTQGDISTYKDVKLHVIATPPSGKPAWIKGALNLDPDSKNVLFIVKESVQKTIPYQSISALQFYMASRVLRILYKDGSGAEQYVDMELPKDEQPVLLKKIQAQTGIAVRLS